MSDFDLKSPDVRILECGKCDEPVMGEPSGARVTLTCGYCGFEDVRELTTTRGADDTSAYRGRRTKEARVLRMDLAKPIDGVPQRATLATIREHFLKEKHALAAGVPDDDRADIEFRLVWLAANLAVHQMAGRDFLHARAVLEATLEAVATPAYRGLVLARLARLAALSNAQDLGKKWLDLAPRGIRVAEVTSDLRVAEAMLAQSRGAPEAVLKIIGERDTADEFVGGSRWLAVALRVDAHEKMGDGRLARQLWRQASRGNAMILSGTAAAYGLATGTRKRVGNTALVAVPSIVLAIWGLVGMIRGVVGELPVGPQYVLATLVGLGLAFALTRL